MGSVYRCSTHWNGWRVRRCWMCRCIWCHRRLIWSQTHQYSLRCALVWPILELEHFRYRSVERQMNCFCLTKINSCWKNNDRKQVITHQIAENDLSDGFIVFFGDFAKLCIVQKSRFLFSRNWSSQWTISSDNDITLATEIYQFLLVDLRRCFDLHLLSDEKKGRNDEQRLIRWKKVLTNLIVNRLNAAIG